MIDDLKIRLGVSSDVTGVAQLNQYYVEAFSRNREKGFFRNAFTIEQIELLVNHRWVIVAESHDQVIGYYLANPILETPTILERKHAVDILIANGELPGGRYSYQVQAAVASNYTGRGVSRKMLNSLLELVAGRLDYLIGYIDTLNTTARAIHLHSGWKIISEFPGGCLGWKAVKAPN